MRRNLRTRREWPGITMMLATGVIAIVIAADQDADARAVAPSTVPPVSAVVVPAEPAGGGAGVLHTHR